MTGGGSEKGPPFFIWLFALLLTSFLDMEFAEVAQRAR